ncbi:MAG: hypothetical protein U0166_23860 [Acidobacteriota bacterium]
MAPFRSCRGSARRTPLVATCVVAIAAAAALARGAQKIGLLLCFAATTAVLLQNGSGGPLTLRTGKQGAEKRIDLGFWNSFSPWSPWRGATSRAGHAGDVPGAAGTLGRPRDRSERLHPDRRLGRAIGVPEVQSDVTAFARDACPAPRRS